MANPTLTAVAEPDSTPPRVRIDISDTGSPDVSEVTVLRTDPGGQQLPVRTADGDVFTLTPSGSDFAGTLYDYEAPFGQPVTYSLLENAASTATLTLDPARAWLIHPGVPSRSLPIKVTELDEPELTVRRGVFRPMNRETAVVNTDGRRRVGDGLLVVRTESLADRAAMKTLLSDAQTLLLNIPLGHEWGLTWMYVAIDSVRPARPQNTWGSHPWRRWPLPFTVVSRPEGGAQSQWTLGDIEDAYLTLGDIEDAYLTLGDIEANTPVA